jgi:hypothetical protein
MRLPEGRRPERRSLQVAVVAQADGLPRLLVQRFGSGRQRLTGVGLALAAAEGLVQPGGVVALQLDALTSLVVP